ncbi:MAG: hypothetical protein HYY16_11330 [Planctomycetes bacterium]|nr:hypothetical protein [Planctomycetota bacterium]
MPNRGGGQRGPGGPTEGEYVADKGIHARTDNNEIIKKGDKAAMKDRDGNWSTPQQDGEGRGRRGRGDFLARLSPPHETFRDIEKNFTKVTKSTEGDLTAYSGELTADGAAKLSGRGNFGRAGGRDGDTPRKSDGTAKIYVNGDGDIVKVVVNTSTKFSRADGEETEIKSERTIEISNRGNADFQVPDEAKKILSE